MTVKRYAHHPNGEVFESAFVRDPVSGALRSVQLVQLSGSSVAEALTDADAVNGVLTFSEPVRAVEIWHAEETLQEFIVNGVTIPVGPGGWRSPVGGTPSAEVTIPMGVTCAVSRLV